MKLLTKVTFLKPIINKLSILLNRRQKIYIAILLVLTIGFSLIETIGISVIMPFISIVSDPSVLNDGLYKKVFDFFNFSNVNKFIIILGIGIIIFYILRAVYSVLLTWFINRFSTGVYKYFSKKVFKTYLSVSYRVYVQKNSAVLMQAISTETSDVGNTILNLLQFFSEIFTIVMIYVVIFILNWRMTVTVTVVLLIIVSILLAIMSRINKTQGEKRLIAGRNITRTLKETLGNIKFIKLKGNEENVMNVYDSAIGIRTRADVINRVLSVVPKSILESIGFSFLIAIIIFFILVYNDASKVIPVISLYALALYRILPSVHRMLQNINNIAFVEKTLDSVYESLQQPVENEGASPIEFKNSISLENIKFKYITGNEIINDVTLKINKGDKIAITGDSGCGKSTLVDIITGIHKPISGKLLIDDKIITDSNICSWRKKIGYIPQSIYLFDGTVAENVSFGSVYDENKIITSLKKANIWEFLLEKDGLNTHVGDGGIQLSGGQQQRIGIARAIYDDPEVLVLDEATSALDSDTEQKIMNEIYTISADKTLIIIAHRLSTVERCDRKIRLENGRIVKDSN